MNDDDDSGSGPNPYDPPEADLTSTPEVAKEANWFDRQFVQTRTPILMLAAFCCSLPALILSILGLIFTTAPEANRKAKLLFFVSLGWLVVGILLRVYLLSSSGSFQP